MIDSKFEKELEKDLKKISDNIKNVAKTVSKKISKEIVWASPVWTGHYVLSHRIGINAVDVSITPGIGGYVGKKTKILPKKASTAQISKMRSSTVSEQISKLESVENFDRIILSNSARHAGDVEFGNPETNTKPYAIYRRHGIFAEKILNQKLKSIK